MNDSDELQKRSALFWPEKLCNTTPLLIMHGTRDNRVPALDSIELAAKLYAHKVPFRLNIYEGGDHYLSEFKSEALQESEKWFERFLKKGEALPNIELEELK